MAEMRDLIKRLDHIENLKEEVDIGDILNIAGALGMGTLGGAVSIFFGMTSPLNANEDEILKKLAAEHTASHVANQAAASELASSSSIPSAENISKITGNLLSPDTISNLADLAIKYALPAAAIVAILYGGKVLYDYIVKHKKQNPPARHSLAEMMETVRLERITREML